MLSDRVFILKNSIQNYAWGKFGRNSEVAKLVHSSDKDFNIDENIPYAELWMGTHPKGPSTVIATGELLSEWIRNHQDCLGNKTRRVFPDSVDQLPFLFKVLSVNKALSIQAHPNKEEAEKLHRENAKEYPDSNHKPEMAIALTPFEALCGFRPIGEIINFLECLPELQTVIGKSIVKSFSINASNDVKHSELKECFRALMTSSEDLVKDQLLALVTRMRMAKETGNVETLTAGLGHLLLRLYDEFPGDVGCCCIYFLNYMTLETGEALFLEANLPHAYLYGDCLECMACSDNVVRAGLTPKYKDVSTLCSLLKYDSKASKDFLFNSSCHSSDPFVTIFNPPVEDFSVYQIRLPPGVEQYVIEPVDGASILIVIQGEAEATNSTLGTKSLNLERGSVVFASANESITLNRQSSHDKEMLIYRACCV